jgi:uncharacterized cupredoxin-like copper-binding protein
MRSKHILSLSALSLIVACGPVSSVTDGGVTDGGQTALVSAETMVAAACSSDTCTTSKVVGYWKDLWTDHAVQRTVRFVETDATHFSYAVTDGAGAPSTLEFEAGVPVTLTLVNPGDGTSKGKHYLTAPEFFRTVAWRKAETADAEYKAPYFDAVEVLYAAGSEKLLKLYFVPIVAGSFDAYCEIGVQKGANGKPDHSTGHSGLGMKLPIKVTSRFTRSLDTELESAWVSALGSDSRRSGSHAVWADGARNDSFKVQGGAPIRMVEVSGGALAFEPKTIRLTEGVGYVLGFSNVGSQGKHYFTAPTLFASSVVRKTEDSHSELKAPYFSAIELLPGKSASMFLVPTKKGEYPAVCEIGVTKKPDGTLDHATGHAGKGMTATVIVE